jgi:hypothetical protein
MTQASQQPRVGLFVTCIAPTVFGASARRMVGSAKDVTPRAIARSADRRLSEERNVMMILMVLSGVVMQENGGRVELGSMAI